MKRDTNLQDLSRDHHHSLVLARRAEKTASTGSDEEIASMWESIADVFDSDLEPHFNVEERHLLPPLEAGGEDEMARRVRSEHNSLRTLRARIGDDRDRLRQFGALLREHVRFEERELFPKAEEMLRHQELNAVAEASAAMTTAQQRAAVREKRSKK